MQSRTAHSIAGLAGLCAIFALIGALQAQPPSEPAGGSAPRLGGGNSYEDRLRFVSPRGHDRAPGTAKRPWRTLTKAGQAARPGDTIVLMSGVHGRRGRVHLFDRGGKPGRPITFAGARGGRLPQIRGFVKIAASHLRFSDLDFAGPTGRVKPFTPDNPRGENVRVAIDANGRTLRDILLRRSVVRDSLWHAGIYVAHAVNVRIVGNYIHDNGDPTDPGQANLSHGIYWHSGSGLIANNVVEDNVARGIQLYPRASRVTAVHNTVVRNGSAGIQLGARASHNRLFNNIVVFNHGAGVRPASLSGVDNVARRNLLWGNGEQREWSPGLTSFETMRVAPLFERGYGLRPHSEAVDRAIPSRLSPPTDRLGVRRPRGASSDLGAFESW